MAFQDLTINAKIDPNWKDLPSINNKLEFEWAAQAYTSEGDTTSDLRATFDLASWSEKYYYVVTDILWYTSSATELYGYINNQEWEDFYIQGATASELAIYDADKNQTTAPNNQSLISEWMYLGKPREEATTPGEITFQFTANTATAYTIFMRGFALKKPLSTKGLFIQPFPLL